jgi:hypothetical protein
MRKPKLVLTAATAAALLATGVAYAATKVPASASLKPNTPHKGVTVKVSAGPFAAGHTLPSALTLTLAKGFSTSSAGGVANSAATLCTAAEESNDTCPSSSRVGTGSLTFTPSPALFGATSAIPLGITFYLGEPRKSGCVATVQAIFQVTRNSTDMLLNLPAQSGIGDLCPHAGGLKLSFPEMPTYSYYIPSSSTVTISKLTLSLGASSQGHNLVKDPPSCPASKKWAGSLYVTAGSSTHRQLKFACKR